MGCRGSLRTGGLTVRVLVTGARGLLGSAIVARLLAVGDEVRTLQRRPSGLARPYDVVETLGDLGDPSAVAQAMRGCDAIVHSAARVGLTGSWAQFAAVNVMGTRTVIGQARRNGIPRLVYVSSPSVAHSGQPLIGASAEPADPEHTRSPYAQSKAVAEQTVLAENDEALRTVAIRPHLVWGPGDMQLIAPIVERARAGRLLVIDAGHALIDTTYVDNAAAAIVAAVRAVDEPEVNGRAWVVSNGEPRTVAEIFTRIALAAGLRPRLRDVSLGTALLGARAAQRWWALSRRQDDPPLTTFLVEQLTTAHWFDQTQTRAALDWSPEVSLAEGFQRLAVWFAERPAT